MKTIAVIPCLNEQRHIVAVVKGALKYVDTVLVMDGESQDGTAELARRAGAKVYRGKLGLGANLKRGLNFATSYKPDVIVLLDGDGQHNPDLIPNLLKPIQDGMADVVMGNRKAIKGFPPYRIFGNGVLTAFANWHSRVQFADSMVGFWALTTEAVPALTESGWGIYTEMLMKVRSNGHRIVSVGIEPIYHPNYEDNSTLPAFNLGIRLLYFILKWRLKCEIFKG
jgi:glycosyltransferase involved in cell wall biosynthesis